MTPTRALVTRAVAALAIAATLSACGDGADDDSDEAAAVAEDPAEWQRLPDPPFPERTRAVGVWTGDEVLVVGGDRFSCPPNADCTAPSEPPMRDGAALDLDAGTWRAISDAPLGFHSAHAAVIGDDVYVIAFTDYAGEAALLHYDIARDTWSTLETPAGDDLATYDLVATDSSLVAYASTEELGVIGDHVFDPAAGTWAPLPHDPLTRAFDRVMVWADPHLYLFDKEHVRQPGSAKPSVLRAARLDPVTDRWERLPDSEIIGGGVGWFADGERLINPLLGGADGGEVNGWDRTYPNGGVLEIASATWTTLPGADSDHSAGVFDERDALYLGTGGHALDATTDRWVAMPELRDGLLLTNAGRTAVAKRDDGYWRWTP